MRERTLRVLEERGPHDFHELVLRHELQHTETMRQALFLGGLDGGSPPALASFPGDPDWVEIPNGSFEMGANGDGFAYDNERPRHAVELPAFRITRTPITNATWLTFSEGGGYERREWWSDEGWAWKQDYDITHPLGWAGGDDDRPVQHVSWFEADAFARSLGARLPTEQEWERARSAVEGVGLVWEWTVDGVRRLSRLRGLPVPRVQRGLLPQGLPRAARRLVGGLAAGGDDDVPQLGPAAAAPDLQRPAARGGRLTW